VASTCRYQYRQAQQSVNSCRVRQAMSIGLSDSGEFSASDKSLVTLSQIITSLRPYKEGIRKSPAAVGTCWALPSQSWPPLYCTRTHARTRVMHYTLTAVTPRHHHYRAVGCCSTLPAQERATDREGTGERHLYAYRHRAQRSTHTTTRGPGVRGMPLS
jgi:hypothetical protein